MHPPPAPAHHACLTTRPQARTVRQAHACPEPGPRGTVTARRAVRAPIVALHRDASQPGNPPDTPGDEEPASPQLAPGRAQATSMMPGIPAGRPRRGARATTAAAGRPDTKPDLLNALSHASRSVCAHGFGNLFGAPGKNEIRLNWRAPPTLATCRRMHRYTGVQLPLISARVSCMIAATGRRPAVCHRRGATGLRTPGTGGHGWLASGIRGMGCRQVLRQEAGQRVKQEMPGAEVGRGGPDAPAGDELQSGGR
jgi:hypothetical protein